MNHRFGAGLGHPICRQHVDGNGDDLIDHTHSSDRKQSPKHGFGLSRLFWLIVCAVVVLVTAIALPLSLQYNKGQQLFAHLESIDAKGNYRIGGPNWLRRMIGDEQMHAFDHVYKLVLRDIDDTKIEPLTHLDELVHLNLYETNITGDGLHNLLGSQPKLQFLRISQEQIDTFGLQPISEMKQLGHLALHANTVVGEDFSFLSHLPNLRHLSLPRETDGSNLRYLSAAPALRWLDLSGSGVADDHLKHLSSLSVLETIFLDGTLVSGEGLKHLPPSVTWMTLRNTPLTTEGLTRLSGLTNLKRLSISGTQIAQMDLTFLRSLPNLTYLGLTHLPIDDEDLHHLENLHSLGYLSLHDTRVKDAGLKHIQALTNLRTLNLDETLIEGHGLKHLSGLPALKSITLGGKAIDDDDIVALSGLRRLQTVDLRGTMVTSSGMNALQQHTPSRISFICMPRPRKLSGGTPPAARRK